MKLTVKSVRNEFDENDSSSIKIVADLNSGFALFKIMDLL